MGIGKGTGMGWMVSLRPITCWISDIPLFIMRAVTLYVVWIGRLLFYFLDTQYYFPMILSVLFRSLLLLTCVSEPTMFLSDVRALGSVGHGNTFFHNFST